MIQFQTRVRIVGKKAAVEHDCMYREDTIPDEEQLAMILESAVTKALVEWSTRTRRILYREKPEDYFARFEKQAGRKKK